MIRVWAILFGLAVAIAAGMVVKAAFAKAAAQFDRHIQAGPDDLETAARGGGVSGGGVFVPGHKKASSRLLSGGSEKQG